MVWGGEHEILGKWEHETVKEATEKKIDKERGKDYERSHRFLAKLIQTSTHRWQKYTVVLLVADKNLAPNDDNLYADWTDTESF